MKTLKTLKKFIGAISWFLLAALVVVGLAELVMDIVPLSNLFKFACLTGVVWLIYGVMTLLLSPSWVKEKTQSDLVCTLCKIGLWILLIVSVTTLGFGIIRILFPNFLLFIERGAVRYIVLGVILSVIFFIINYFLGKSDNDEEIEELEAQTKELLGNKKEAPVVEALTSDAVVKASNEAQALTSNEALEAQIKAKEIELELYKLKLQQFESSKK